MKTFITCGFVFLLCFILSVLQQASAINDTNSLPTTVSTKNITAHFCPHPCTVGNKTICTPVPCPPPPCFDPARYKPTDCCVYCPHGKLFIIINVYYKIRVAMVILDPFSFLKFFLDIFKEIREIRIFKIIEFIAYSLCLQMNKIF